MLKNDPYVKAASLFRVVSSKALKLIGSFLRRHRKVIRIIIIRIILAVIRAIARDD